MCLEKRWVGIREPEQRCIHHFDESEIIDHGGQNWHFRVLEAAASLICDLMCIHEQCHEWSIASYREDSRSFWFNFGESDDLFVLCFIPMKNGIEQDQTISSSTRKKKCSI